MMKEVEQQAGSAGPREPEKMTATDREVVDLFVACLRRQIAAEAAEAAETPAGPLLTNKPADHAGAERRRGRGMEGVRRTVA
jgi:hypothetical protein